MYKSFAEVKSALASGKTVLDYLTKSEMVYNRENLLNNWFIVA